MKELYNEEPPVLPGFTLEHSPVTADELEYDELAHLEGRKAVPGHIAPSFVGKALSEPISALLEGWCSSWFRIGHLPEEWRSGWIVFLTNPTRCQISQAPFVQ